MAKRNIDFFDNLNFVEKFIIKLNNQCENLMNSREGQVSADFSLLINVGIMDYSNILRYIDEDDEDLKKIAQELFMCLGTPVDCLHHETIDLKNTVKVASEIKEEIQKLKLQPALN